MKRLLLVLLLWPVWAFCGPQVLVTVAPYKYIIETIAKQSVQVQVLVPPAASPHSFEPTAKELIRASQSDLWFRIGEPFEKKSIAVLKDNNKKMVIVDLRKGVIDCPDDGHCDNHIWLSIKLMKMQAKIIKDALIKLLPQNGPLYEARYRTLIADLDRLSTQFAKRFQQHPTKAILVSHPAFAYFCRDYGIQQLSVEMEGREPTLKQSEELIAKVRKLGVTKAIIEPQYQNKGTELIARQLNLPLFLVDPYAESWYDNMIYIAETFSS